METTKGSGTTGKLIAAVVAILIVSGTLVYYESTVAQNGGSLASQVKTLEGEVSSLSGENSALQAELAQTNSTTTGSGTNSSGLSSEALYSYASPSVVTIQGDELIVENSFFGEYTEVELIQGSGFVTSYQGSPYIVTNYHVVDGVSNITATFSDGNSYPAKVIGTDEYSDLAVLTVDAPSSEFRPLTIVNSTTSATVGEPVYAIGSPFGLSGSMTFGIVSQVGRTITEDTPAEPTISNVIQFSAPINPGNSGGPLLNVDGEVVGITTATVSDSEGLGFAIPSSTIEKELPSLIATGGYDLHSTLELTGVDMTYQLAQAMGSNVTYGVLVETVTSGGPAAKAGIRGGTSNSTIDGYSYLVGGDIIVSINGVRVVDTDALGSYLAEYTVAGQTVELGIIRSGTLMTVEVVLGALPA